MSKKLTTKEAILVLHRLLAMINIVQDQKRITWKDTKKKKEGVAEISEAINLVKRAILEGVVKGKEVDGPEREHLRFLEMIKDVPVIDLTERNQGGDDE